MKQTYMYIYTYNIWIREANSAAFLPCLVLIWTKHCKTIEIVMIDFIHTGGCKQQHWGLGLIKRWGFTTMAVQSIEKLGKSWPPMRFWGAVRTFGTGSVGFNWVHPLTLQGNCAWVGLVLRRKWCRDGWVTWTDRVSSGKLSPQVERRWNERF